MPNVEFIHSSYMGSYRIPCEIREKLENDFFRISFMDPVILAQVERIVEKRLLVFPKLADYLM